MCGNWWHTAGDTTTPIARQSDLSPRAAHSLAQSDVMPRWLPQGRLPKFRPSLGAIPENRPLGPLASVWEDFAVRLVHWYDHARWEGYAMAEKVEMLQLLDEDSD